MLVDGLDAASQFNREYSRLFGQPPIWDIRTLRSPGALPPRVGQQSAKRYLIVLLTSTTSHGESKRSE
jgi:hypothetical protein